MGLVKTFGNGATARTMESGAQTCINMVAAGEDKDKIGIIGVAVKSATESLVKLLNVLLVGEKL